MHFKITKSRRNYPFGFRLDCDEALGMEDKRIRDDQITASTWLYYTQERNQHYSPYLARLHDRSSSSGGWCSESIYAYKNAYIEIDLLQNTRLTGLATQGRNKHVEYVEKYKIKYQREGDMWRKYRENGDWKVGTMYKNFVISKAILFLCPA